MGLWRGRWFTFVEKAAVTTGNVPNVPYLGAIFLSVCGQVTVVMKFMQAPLLLQLETYVNVVDSIIKVNVQGQALERDVGGGRGGRGIMSRASASELHKSRLSRPSGVLTL